MPEDPIALLRYLLFNLWRQRWLILSVAWLVALVGWLAVAALPDRFTAKAQIFVDTDSILGPLMNNLAVAPDVQGQVQMMRQTLLSRPNLEAVADKVGLLEQGGERLQQEGRAGHDLAQGRTAQLDPSAGQHVLLPIEGQMIAGLAGDHLRHQAKVEPAAGHGARWSFSLLHAAVLLRAGVFGRHIDLHHDFGGTVIDALGAVFADFYSEGGKHRRNDFLIVHGRVLTGFMGARRRPHLTFVVRGAPVSRSTLPA